MFISKYGKTYDDADGSEQGDARATSSRTGAQRGGQVGSERWEDDGGPANDRPAPIMASPPAWSVLSLSDLNDAIRREHAPNDPARLRADFERARRGLVARRQLAADREAAAALASADRYRNAWEHT